MGAALGVISPIDASTKRQLENAIKDCIGTFTKEYLKSYAIHLVKKIKADAQSEPEDWKLEDRPVRNLTCDNISIPAAFVVIN